MDVSRVGPIFKCARDVCNATENIMPDRWARITAGTAYAMSCVVGISVNLITLVALPRCRTLMGKPATYFILNLAASDLIYCALAMPVDSYTYLSGTDWQWSKGAVRLCEWSAWAKYISALMDWSSLAWIAVERYVKIVRGNQTHAKVFCLRNVGLILAFTWFLHGFLLTVFAHFGFNVHSFRCDMCPKTKLDVLDRGSVHISWMMIVTCIITACCVRIHIYVRHSAAEMLRFKDKRRFESKLAAVAADLDKEVADCCDKDLAYSPCMDTSSIVGGCSTYFVAPGREEAEFVSDTSSVGPKVILKLPGRPMIMREPASTEANGSDDDGDELQGIEIATRDVPPAPTSTNGGTHISGSLPGLPSASEKATNNNNNNNSNNSPADHPPGPAMATIRPIPSTLPRRSIDSLRRVLFRRELNLVKTLAMTTGAYIALVSPMCIVNFTDYCVQYPNLLLMSYTLYVSIYFVNFVIYVTLHQHHRKMCLKTLEEFWGCLANFPRIGQRRGLGNDNF